MELGSKLTAALEDLWKQIQKNHPEVPTAVVSVASGVVDYNAPRWGHVVPRMWGSQAVGHEDNLHHVLISGEAETYYGEGLKEHVTMRPGDLQYVPAGCPHLSVNRSKTEPCVGVVARTDPNEQESVVMLPELDGLVPLDVTGERSDGDA
jgi:uncharacterized RmlC-like cupin family protein